MAKPVDPSTLPYRPCVGICLLNAQGLVFVGQRRDTPGAWQMPQGGIDKGETAAEAGLRELMEEIGTDKATLLEETTEWLRYDLPPELVGVAWKGKYRGQKQKWLACRFTGQDGDINLDTDHPEFDAWQWVPLERTVDLIVPFKREIYTQVVAAFRHLVD
ncbi:RNA pyrophosphohydrolase [Nitrospirillum sp. BR 11828]|uniref:RNA pyrophosphohydrolase n=1 Tax=Nitrospirillum sp. BR 11828 TaxID=3104325 RepID=UPI002ACA972E|nr:RNA pyrophosphohydrolase [Nitrospirillum sp. BR 11828]MDZ5647221.1 RNA pyrophosphohydrolase [Nitrospirillum sp. BR 11828]